MRTIQVEDHTDSPGGSWVATFDTDPDSVRRIVGCPAGEGATVEAAVRDLLQRAARESGIKIDRVDCKVGGDVRL